MRLGTSISEEEETKDLLGQWQEIMDVCERAAKLGFSITFTPDQLKSLIAIGREVQIDMSRKPQP